MTASPPPYPQHDPRAAYPPARPAPGPPPPGHPGHPGHPQPGYPPPATAGYPPLPTIPPAAFTRRYRTTAWALIWVPVVLMVAAAVLSIALLVYADSDPSRNSAAGYLAIVVWGVMLVGGPVLLGAFIPGCVMLSRSNRARALARATSLRPPA
ncbi:hypothetical protein JN535_03035 [Cellulosimicrobium cellulans]|uniref:hypothetical protein n=1 Tax=Cellulosimicrobium cellulans TaxID=1710 RepID=UPI00196263A6|nr:hypothetical protein [Cellulosimicrobium cellulans]MBN0039148.1 hypothetical protein [Cellulosimicrobium cellulans]